MHPTLLVPQSLAFSVSMDVLRVRLSVCAPVAPVGFSPPSLAVPLIVTVVGIISHLLSVPPPLPLPLASRLRAIRLIFHPRARVEQPTAGQTATPPRQDTPPFQGCSLRMPLSSSSMVGQFGEHFARWLRWVNFVSTQAGGSVFRSTGGSIFESVKGH